MQALQLLPPKWLHIPYDLRWALSDRCVLSLCDWLLLQSLEHWEEVFAVLEGETLSLFTDREAAAEVRQNRTLKASTWWQKIVCNVTLGFTETNANNQSGVLQEWSKQKTPD